VEDQHLCRSRRLQGLSPVTFEPPLPPFRHMLYQEGSFEATKPQEIVLEPTPIEYFPTPKDYIVSDLQTRGFRPSNHLITDLSTFLLIHIVPPEVTSPERQFVQ